MGRESRGQNVTIDINKLGFNCGETWDGFSFHTEHIVTWRNGHYADKDQTINAGSVLNFRGEVEGGKKPYSSYSWNFNGGATNSSIQNPGNVTFNIPGSYPVIFKVTDANGNTGSTYRIFIVSATQSSSTPTLSAVIILPEGNQTITAGQSVFFLGSVIGGTAPYTYKWNSGVDTEVAQEIRTGL